MAGSVEGKFFMIVKKYKNEFKSEWDNFVEHSKMPMFMFKRNFMEYHSHKFVDFSLMFYDEKNKLIAILPASISNNEVISHAGLTYGGFVTNESMKQHHMNDCFESLIDYLKQNGIKRLIYKTIPHEYHIVPAEEDLYPLWRFNARLCRRDVSSVINLKHPVKMLKSRCSQSARAKREGFLIKETDDVVSFIDLVNSVLGYHHNTKAVHSADELKLLKSYFPDNIKLWTAQYEGKISACSLLFVYPNVVYTQYIAADETARKLGGLDFLFTTLINHFASTKCFFDFGASTIGGGKVFLESLLFQKEGFGARSVAHDTYELNL